MLFGKKNHTWGVDLPRATADIFVELAAELGIEAEDLRPDQEETTIKIVLPEKKILSLGRKLNVRPYQA